jgi:hypothetical protein
MNRIQIRLLTLHPAAGASDAIKVNNYILLHYHAATLTCLPPPPIYTTAVNYVLIMQQKFTVNVENCSLNQGEGDLFERIASSHRPI